MNTNREGTMTKRERQARRLLRVCLREFSASCLQGYVDAYEGDDLAEQDAMNCALGSMHPSGAGVVLERHGRAASHVEKVFEGWGLFYGSSLDSLGIGNGYPSWNDAPHEVRRRWIYEACVEELARRNFKSVPSPEARFVGVER